MIYFLNFLKLFKSRYQNKIMKLISGSSIYKVDFKKLDDQDNNLVFKFMAKMSLSSISHLYLDCNESKKLMIPPVSSFFSFFKMKMSKTLFDSSLEFVN